MNEQLIMELIIHGGNARSLAMDSIKKARNFNFAEANELIEEAEKEELQAHRAQTKLLQEACAEEGTLIDKTNVSLLLVHALDHVSMGSMSIDIAKEIIENYRLVEEIKREKK